LPCIKEHLELRTATALGECQKYFFRGITTRPTFGT
jgi:hypothetical protein